MSTVTKQPSWIVWLVAALVMLEGASQAQAQMPDPRQMSGIPRPVDDLPNGSVSVRVIRGSLSNNIPNQAVELQVGSQAKTAQTDESGRAQFDGLTPGATLKAVAVVDGERLESQEFPAPAQGGIRLLLVATDRSKPQTAPSAAVAGPVVLGNQSRIVFQPGDEAVRVDYMLHIVNGGAAPVNPPAAFVFDLPGEAVGQALMEGSAPQATVTGKRVRVDPPFQPGTTFVHLAYELPAASGSITMTQHLPATMEELAVVVRKVGDTKLSSSQLTMQQDMAVESDVFIAAAGGSIAPGQPIVLSVGNVPHHSRAPRWTALSLALGIVVVGVWISWRSEDAQEEWAAERKRLIARREKLFVDLVRLEAEHRNGKTTALKYGQRREEIVAQLEQIYGALDRDDTNPGPADRPGLAA